MAFPAQREIEIPLLKALIELGGEAKPQDIYPKVAAAFPHLTDEEQVEMLPHSPRVRRWWNLVQWARQRLVESGDLDGTTRGIWRITPAGVRRARGGTVTPPNGDKSLRDLATQNLDEVKRRIRDEFHAMDPRRFQEFCIELLEQLGYEDLRVGQQGADGGIDGDGEFRQGAVRIRSAFQVKRLRENSAVGRPEIDRFRGAIQGQYDHGVFLTTSRFSREAKEASTRRGAITITLFDGDYIAGFMVERGIGVRKAPVYLIDLDAEFFKTDT